MYYQASLWGSLSWLPPRFYAAPGRLKRRLQAGLPAPHYAVTFQAGDSLRNCAADSATASISAST